MLRARYRSVLLSCFLLACVADRQEEPEGPDEPGPAVDCQKSETACSGANFQTCIGGKLRTKKTCISPQVCDPKLACVDCRPGIVTCAGDEVRECASDGTLGDAKETCAPGGCKEGVCVDTCQPSASDLIYVVDETYRLLSFDPRMGKNEFQLIGQIDCPAGPGLPGLNSPATPFSMSVDRDGQAWVLFTSGEIFWVSTKDASCKKSAFKPQQAGFDVFGMGFVSDAKGSIDETLFIAGGDALQLADGSLGRVEKKTLVATNLAKLQKNEDYGPELTGTGNGELYGYFPGTTKTIVAQIDKMTAQNVKHWEVEGLGGSARAWAFAHWGGRFYIFITTLEGGTKISTQVQLFDPVDGKKTTIVTNVPYVIVGAGVSTCAPVIIG
jgi:hypothetical protein